MHESPEELQRDVDELRSEMHQLKSNLNELGGTIKGLGRHGVHVAKNKANEELGRLVDQITQAYDNVKKQGGEASQTMRARIEEKPMASIGIAFAVGLVLGKLFSRR